jgi:hypothetical protein
MSEEGVIHLRFHPVSLVMTQAPCRSCGAWWQWEGSRDARVPAPVFITCESCGAANVVFGHGRAGKEAK